MSQVDLKQEMEKTYEVADPWDYRIRSRHEILLALVKQFGQIGRFVELGSAEGVFTMKVPDVFKKDYLAVDISQTAVLRASTQEPEISYQVMAAEDWLAQRESFSVDTLIVSDLTPYLRVPIRAYFEMMVRVLSVKGILIMTSWDSAWRGASMFPEMEFQKEMETKFIGKALVPSVEGYEYSAQYYVGRKRA